MKPKSRLLIRLTLPNGDMKSWGYDQPYFKTSDQLHEAIVRDFEVMPDHTEINFFYFVHEGTTNATDATSLADAAIAWLQLTGDYN